jgi:hypothetical protein
MAVTFNATAGSATANSYCTVAEADDYHSTRLFATTWTLATTPTKEAALMWATRLLEGSITWTGIVTNAAVQVLQWPRQGMIARNLLAYVDSATIPVEVKNACAELARQLIAADRTADNDVETSRIRSVTAGPIAVTFGEGVWAKVLPDAIYTLLVPDWIESAPRLCNTRDLERC